MTRLPAARSGVCQVTALVIACVGVGAATHAQTLTIPQQVERVRPGPLVLPQGMCRCLPDPLDRAVREADIVAVGRLVRPRPHLSADEREFYTDYEFEPSQVIATKHAPAAPRPGLETPIVVHHWGGEMTVNGVLVKTGPGVRAVLTPDRPLLAFLTRDKDIDKYRITLGFVFEIDDEQRVTTLQPSTVDPRLNRMPLGDVIGDVQWLLSGRDRLTPPWRAEATSGLANWVGRLMATSESGWVGSKEHVLKAGWRRWAWSRGGDRLHITWSLEAEPADAHRVLEQQIATAAMGGSQAAKVADEAVIFPNGTLHVRHRSVYAVLSTNTHDSYLTNRIAFQLVGAVNRTLDATPLLTRWPK